MTDRHESAGDLRDRALLATSTSFTISDPSAPDNALVWVNPAFTATTGYAAEDVLGSNCRFLQGPDTDQGVVEEIRRSLARADPITVILLNYRKDGTPFWNQLAISPVQDAAGALTHFVGVQTDVSDKVDLERARELALSTAERATARLGLVAEFTGLLGSAITPDEVARRVSQFTVERLATWSAFYPIDDAGRLQRPVLEHRRATEPQIAAALTRLGEIVPAQLPPDSPIRLVLSRRERHVLIRLISDDRELLADDERSRLDRILGLNSVLVVPLVSRGAIAGALVLVRDDAEPPFTDDDLSLLLDLAGRAALAFENAQLFTRQRDASETLQRSLLPELPVVAGLEICADYLPATARAAVGGDWYDVVTQADGRVGIAVGDVMGHDLDAAASMGQLRSALLAYAWPGAEASTVLDHLDRLVSGLGLGQLATCGYGALTRRADGGGCLEWSSAGHPPPVVRLPGQPCQLVPSAQDRMIGLAHLIPDSPPRTTVQLDLAPGAQIICYTDGLLDAFDTDLDVAWAALRALIDAQPADLGCEDLVSVLTTFAQDSGRTDDIAVLVVALET